MPSIQAALHEGKNVLAASLAVVLTQSEDPLAGSFTLPVRCSINLDTEHHLVLADGRTVPITILNLSHFSGDVEFRQAANPASTA